MNELITMGIQLMATGMVIVFAFLALLVIAVNVLTVVVQNFFPTQQPSQKTVSMFAGEDNSGVVAAITAAVIQYRQKHSK